MDFSLTEEQGALKKSARDFLARKCPPELVEEMMEDRRGYPPDLWEEMAGLGWQGLLIPPEYGGSGGSFLDLIVLLEEMGRASLPGPFLTGTAAALLVMEAGNQEQKRALLPEMAGGGIIAVMALQEPRSGYDVLSPETILDSDGKLNGTKLFIPYAHVARYLICSAASERGGVTLYLIDSDRPGVTIKPLKTMGVEKQNEVRLEGVSVSGKDVLGSPGEGGPVLEKVLDMAAVAKCAEMAGGLQYVLDLTVDYAKQRQQSGRPIGGFQAIQHYCADMLCDADGSRFITRKAAWEISKGLPFSTGAAVAKAWVSDAYQRSVLIAHQIFGGIGFCREHSLHHYLKQSKLGEIAFGDAAHHLERVASSLGL